MGRGIKRVSMDWEWPRGEVWTGYVNPHYSKCVACHGRGHTRAREEFNGYINQLMWNREGDDELNQLTAGLCGRPPAGRIFGHDSSDSWKAQEVIIKAAGLDPETWGECKVCAGHGDDPAKRPAYEAWRETEPPTGEGWQVWETVSEGSPVSPVMETPEALAKWMAENDTSVMAGTSYENWLAFIHEGWAPSAMAIPGHGVVGGVEGMALSRPAKGATNED